jgi:hypothetical protein
MLGHHADHTGIRRSDSNGYILEVANAKYEEGVDAVPLPIAISLQFLSWSIRLRQALENCGGGEGD